jgi:hypothetical protein
VKERNVSEKIGRRKREKEGIEKREGIKELRVSGKGRQRQRNERERVKR